MSASIFISHAGQDLKVANTLCRALEGRGFKCWISGRDILPGENFQVAIVRAIRAARIMLLVFTGNSNNSEEMTKELALASQHRLIVIPLRIEDVTPNEAFSYEFATRQWIDFFADWEAAMDQLSLRISTAIAADPALAPAAEAPHAELEHAAAHSPVVEPRPVAEPAKPPERVEPPAARQTPPETPPPTPAPATQAAPAPVQTVARAVSPQIEPTKAAPAAAVAAGAGAAVATGAAATAPAAKSPATTAKSPPPSAPKPPPTSFAKAGQVAAAPRAPASGERKGAPVGLFIGLGVVVVAALAAGAWFFAPALLSHPAAPPPKPAIAAAKPPAPVVTPGPAANAATSLLAPANPAAAAAAQEAASAASNAIVAAAPKAARHHAAAPTKTHAEESSGEVPF